MALYIAYGSIKKWGRKYKILATNFPPPSYDSLDNLIDRTMFNRLRPIERFIEELEAERKKIVDHLKSIDKNKLPSNIDLIKLYNKLIEEAVKQVNTTFPDNIKTIICSIYDVTIKNNLVEFQYLCYGFTERLELKHKSINNFLYTN